MQTNRPNCHADPANSRAVGELRGSVASSAISSADRVVPLPASGAEAAPSPRAGAVSRRRVLASAAAAVCGPLLLEPASAFGYAANEQLGIALIGVGGRGQWFVETIPRIGQRVVAMCDVNDARAADSFNKLPDVPKYRDFRKLLDAEDRRLDAVVVATPDHNHAPISAAAMRRGKHVFCEKPLTNSIWEARTLRRLAVETKVATQMGNQGTATHAFREAVEIVQSGMLGAIREVVVWNCGGNSRRPPPNGGEPVPAGLDWDLWLGPAPDRPFHRAWMQWQSWRELGTGKLGNWAIHSANLPCMALRLYELWNEEPKARPNAAGAASGTDPIGPAVATHSSTAQHAASSASAAGSSPPTHSTARADNANNAPPGAANRRPTIKVEAAVAVRDRVSFPNWEMIRYEFPARGTMPPVKLLWCNGIQAPGFREAIEPHLGRKLACGGNGPWLDDSGCLLIGAEGVLHATGHNSSYRLLPEDRWRNAPRPEPTLPRSGSHEREWLSACRGGPAAMSNFGYGGVLTELVLLGNIASQFDRAIDFDPPAMTCPGDDEAAAQLRRPYRTGWTLL